MMPLIYAPVGEENIILKVGGNAQIRSHLESMGFVCGAAITVIATMQGNVIVNIKDTRVAISREMAGRIMV